LREPHARPVNVVTVTRGVESVASRQKFLRSKAPCLALCRVDHFRSLDLPFYCSGTTLPPRHQPGSRRLILGRACEGRWLVKRGQYHWHCPSHAADRPVVCVSRASLQPVLLLSLNHHPHTACSRHLTLCHRRAIVPPTYVVVCATRSSFSARSCRGVVQLASSSVLGCDCRSRDARAL
jgi:hypothetical protein